MNSDDDYPGFLPGTYFKDYQYIINIDNYDGIYEDNYDAYEADAPLTQVRLALISVLGVILTVSMAILGFSIKALSGGFRFLIVCKNLSLVFSCVFFILLLALPRTHKPDQLHVQKSQTDDDLTISFGGVSHMIGHFQFQADTE